MNMFDGPLGEMFKQAQKMQLEMQKNQDELASRELIGESGAGVVKVTLNGKFECLSINIHPNVLTDEPSIICELVASAFNDAVTKVEEEKKQVLNSMASSLNLPSGFKMPFT